MKKSNVLIVLGMARSGTSFTASWLQACGLNIGSRFIKAHSINKKGFFEDIEIHKFHSDILKRHNISEILSGSEGYSLITKKDFERGEELVYQRNCVANEWGWKHPSTIFFMDSLWNHLVPEAKVIVIYRPYWEVVDSLIRVRKKRRNLLVRLIHLIGDYTKIGYEKKINQYLETWIRDNQLIINTIEKKMVNDYCVTSVDHLVNNPQDIFDFITQRMGFHLKFIDTKVIYEQAMLRKVDRSRYPFYPHLVERAESMMLKFESLKSK